jgi:hypothetical protein
MQFGRDKWTLRALSIAYHAIPWAGFRWWSVMHCYANAAGNVLQLNALYSYLKFCFTAFWFWESAHKKAVIDFLCAAFLCWVVMKYFMTTQHCLCSILFRPIVVSCFYYKEPVISIDFAVCHRWASHSMVFLGRTHFTITRSLRCLKGLLFSGCNIYLWFLCLHRPFSVFRRHEWNVIWFGVNFEGSQKRVLNLEAVVFSLGLLGSFTFHGILWKRSLKERTYFRLSEEAAIRRYCIVRRVWWLKASLMWSSRVKHSNSDLSIYLMIV